MIAKARPDSISTTLKQDAAYIFCYRFLAKGKEQGLGPVVQKERITLSSGYTTSQWTKCVNWSTFYPGAAQLLICHVYFKKNNLVLAEQCRNFFTFATQIVLFYRP